MSIADLSSAFGGDDDGGGRTPPQDLYAEQCVLGGMLINKDAIADATAETKSHEFYRPAHELIFDAIVDLFGRGEPADAITVADELGKRGDLTRIGGQAYLHQLIQSVPTAANAGYYAEIVHERYLLRALVESGTRIVQMGYAQGEGEVEDIINRAQAEIFGIGQRQQGGEGFYAADMLDDLMEEIERATERGSEITGIRTGFIDLDELFHGLQPGQLIVMAARPAVGKSTLAIDVVREAVFRQSKFSAVFSLEMGRLEVLKRITAAECTIQLNDLNRGIKKQTDWQKLANFTGVLSAAPLYVDDSPNLTLVEIRAKARRLKQQNDLQLLVVDYLQLMKSGGKVESRQQEVAEFSRSLKLLAKELQIPVIAVSQLNRGPEQRADKRPSMADIRESGAVEQDADIIILIHRDRDDPEKDGEGEFIVAKHRNGATKDVAVAFQGHYARFANMAKDTGDW